MEGRVVAPILAVANANIRYLEPIIEPRVCGTLSKKEGRKTQIPDYRCKATTRTRSAGAMEAIERERKVMFVHNACSLTEWMGCVNAGGG